jgi:hypothetical protein
MRKAVTRPLPTVYWNVLLAVTPTPSRPRRWAVFGTRTWEPAVMYRPAIVRRCAAVLPRHREGRRRVPPGDRHRDRPRHPQGHHRRRLIRPRLPRRGPRRRLRHGRHPRPRRGRIRVLHPQWRRADARDPGRLRGRQGPLLGAGSAVQVPAGAVRGSVPAARALHAEGHPRVGADDDDLPDAASRPRDRGCIADVPGRAGRARHRGAPPARRHRHRSGQEGGPAGKRRDAAL